MKYQTSFLVRTSVESHKRFKKALSIHGGSMSAIVRKLIDEWSSQVIANEVIVYGFARGGQYVTFFKLSQDGKMIKRDLGDKDDAVRLRLIDGITLDDLQDIANALECALVKLNY
jgi:hypothetical protein